MNPEKFALDLTEKRTLKKSQHSAMFAELLNKLLKVLEEEHAKNEDYEVCARLRDAQMSDEVVVEWNSDGEVVSIEPATKTSK